MCKNAICVTNTCGCFKLFVKSTLYSTIILCGRGHQKGIKLDGRDFFRQRRGNAIVSLAEFFRLIFSQWTKFGGGGQIRRLRSKQCQKIESKNKCHRQVKSNCKLPSRTATHNRRQDYHTGTGCIVMHPFTLKRCKWQLYCSNMGITHTGLSRTKCKKNI